MLKYCRSHTALIAGVITAAIMPVTVLAQTAPSQTFAIPQQGVTFVTGDTWQQDGQQMRLYGVQSCLRGTEYTSPAGVRQDCGEASLDVLAADVRDTQPVCSPIAQLAAPSPAEMPTILVVCKAHVGDNVLDLGTVLITQGYAFASFNNSARPVYMPYLVAELAAKKTGAGLWASPDLPHPNAILLKAVSSSK